MTAPKVTPDTPEPDRPKAARNRGPAIGLLGLAALVAILALTQPDPPPVAEATTTTIGRPSSPTTTIAVIAQAEPLRFQAVDLDGIPLAVGETRDGEMVVIRSRFTHLGFEEADVLISRDGLSYEPIAKAVPSGSRIYGAQIGATGMFIHGQDRSGAPTVWRSEDGRSWTSSVVEPEGRWPIYTLGVSETLLLALRYSDSMTEVQEVVADRFDGLPIEYEFSSSSGGPTRLIVRSPLGIAVGSFTLEELGLPADLLDAPGTPKVRASTDGVEWYDATLPFPPSGEMFQGDDGELWAPAYDDFTTRIFSTTNGIEWTERADLRRSGSYVQPWRGGYVSASESLELGLSTNGLSWHRTSFRDHFTNPGEWNFNTLAAGEGGLAILADRYNRGIRSGRGVEEPYVDFEREGLLVRVRPERVQVFGDDRSSPLVELGRWTDVVSPNATYDPGSRELTIHHGPDREPLLTLTIDELIEMEFEAIDEMSFEDLQQVLLTSSDGCAWTVQELDLPSKSYTFMTEVAGDRVVLGVGEFFRTGGRGQLWWAPLPEPGDPSNCPTE